jgi:hypothetical protein
MQLVVALLLWSFVSLIRAEFIFFCVSTASRIRAIVALTAFDEFHRNSAYIIQRAVFGVDADGKLNSSLTFDVNNLVGIFLYLKAGGRAEIGIVVCTHFFFNSVIKKPNQECSQM